MLFSKEDFEVSSFMDLLEFLPIALFLGLLAPLILAAYGLGFLMDVSGWLKTNS